MSRENLERLQLSALCEVLGHHDFPWGDLPERLREQRKLPPEELARLGSPDERIAMLLDVGHRATMGRSLAFFQHLADEHPEVPSLERLTAPELMEEVGGSTRNRMVSDAHRRLRAYRLLAPAHKTLLDSDAARSGAAARGRAFR